MSDKTDQDNGPEFKMLLVENDGTGTIPVPEHVQQDEKAEEICRIWLHSDGSFSNITSPYAVDGPTDWGIVLAGVVRSLAHNRPDGEWDEKQILLDIVRGFLDALGLPIKFLIVRPVPQEPAIDPDKVN